MNKAYVDINWENYPSENTPLNEDNLNKMVSAINLNGENIQSLDVSKATIEEVNPLVKDVTRDENTGIVTVTKKDGSTSKFGTGLDASKQLHLSLYNSDYDPTLEPSSSYFIDKVATLVTGDKNYQHLCAATADESGSVWLQSVDGPAYTGGPKGGVLDLNPLGGDVRANKSPVLTAANWSNYISSSGGTSESSEPGKWYSLFTGSWSFDAEANNNISFELSDALDRVFKYAERIRITFGTDPSKIFVAEAATASYHSFGSSSGYSIILPISTSSAYDDTLSFVKFYIDDSSGSNEFWMAYAGGLKIGVTSPYVTKITSSTDLLPISEIEVYALAKNIY